MAAATATALAVLFGLVASVFLPVTAHAQSKEFSVVQSGVSDGAARDYVDRLRAMLDRSKGITDQGPLSALAAVLEQGRIMSNQPGGIDALRRADDLDLIVALVGAVNTEFRPVRVSGSLLLVNIVDNTTMCAILQALSDEQLAVNSRYNLLQIAKLVASYANRDNSRWISAVVEQNVAALQGKGDTADTVAMANAVLKTLGSSVNRLSFRESFPKEYYACVALPKIAQLEAGALAEQWRHYEIRLHSTRPKSEIDKVESALMAAGFVVSGRDQDVDKVGGPGVDYAPGAFGEYRAAAYSMSRALNDALGTPVPPRPQSVMTGGTFGIWF